ncbi:MAG: WD40/YVTN/BNR-like repeat-containing protein, partial [Blastocatellia bacterium]
MKWRSVGPANMGGRIADIAVDPHQPFTLYVATGTGGLIKSTDNGTTWSGAFENEAVASTGAVEVAPSDSKIVWLGTGEPNGRNSSSWGNGVYKSTDSGGTWTNMGLKDSQDIARVVIDPSNADNVYVAALGHLWGPNKERGVYKTTDGGKTWSASLQVDENTGAVDLLMDPSDHNTLYAAMYYRRRTPYSMTSGGPTGGIYKTADGGHTWKKIANGLPASVGRIGLDVCLSHPNVVYAVIESDAGGQSSIFDNKSKSGGVFRSDDKGETWKRVNGLAPRSFYFSQIRVDPKDENRVYVLGFALSVSDDGGKTFRDDGAKNVHPDLHAMWIDPSNPDHMLLGNDGGIYVSYNKSKTWSHYNNVAIGEFYRVAMDMETPYHITGGLQDNFSWIGPSATRNQDGITNADWRSLGGGDGMWCAIDPTDSNIAYSESQNGTITRMNLNTGEQKFIQPNPKEGESAYRFNWTTPFLLSHFDHTVIYLGGNRLFK